MKHIFSTLKPTLKTWMIAYILITGLLYFTEDWIGVLPLYLRTLLLSGTMVLGLKYIIYLILNRLPSFSTFK